MKSANRKAKHMNQILMSTNGDVTSDRILMDLKIKRRYETFRICNGNAWDTCIYRQLTYPELTTEYAVL